VKDYGQVSNSLNFIKNFMKQFQQQLPSIFKIIKGNSKEDDRDSKLVVTQTS